MPWGVGFVKSVMSSRPGRLTSRPERFGGGRGAIVFVAACRTQRTRLEVCAPSVDCVSRPRRSDTCCQRGSASYNRCTACSAAL